MNTKDYAYSWHLSLRVDRPVEGCNMKPAAYMYGKKLDDREADKPLPPHSKKMSEPPPDHEFSFRWFRGPTTEPCAFEECPRRTSFSPHDWSMHALGGSGCSLQCVSTQSSLFKCTFCNPSCFVNAWKTQYTVPKEMRQQHLSRSRSNTPMRQRSPSYGSNDDMQSVASTGSMGPRLNGTRSPANYNDNGSQPVTPVRGYVGSYHDYNGRMPQGEDWIEISRDQLYTPGPEDVGRKLKLEAAAYCSETGELLMHRVVKTDIVLSRAPDPRKRRFVTTQNVGGAGPRFRMVSYNVLAEIYATQQQYPYCDFWALSWDYRFQNIIRELADANADVVCLQEVQADHYENHFYAAMIEQGYEGVFKQKTRQAMGLAGKVDGCALFWRRSKFHLIESYSIEFNDLAQRQATQVLGLNPRGEGAAFISRLSKDNVAQLIVLELAQPTMTSRSNRDAINQVCIANTHLYSNKDFPDVKLWQAWQLLQELEQFVMSRAQNLPLVICGDFNSTPDTAVYDLLARQTVHPRHPDVNVEPGEGCPKVLPNAINITHSFELGSAYQTVLGEEPKQTNFTSNFKGVLDYIWYSSVYLKPIAVAPIHDEAALTRHGDALPSTEFSSDHIMLITDLQILSGGRPP